MLIGFVTTGILMTFMPKLNPYFAQTLPIGFAGGHGTAAALAQAFADVGYPEGKDVALGTATIGLLSSVTVGILLVNIASRKKWVKHSRMQTGAVRVFRQEFTLEDATRSHACSLEALPCV
jgi:ESS family glutamate:Na+ symporter